MSEENAPARPDQARRELSAALLLVAGGGVLALVAAGRTWITVRQGGAVPPLDAAYTGRDLDGAASTLGLLGLAAVPALLATRRTGRVVLGVLLVLVATLTAVATVTGARLGHRPLPRGRRRPGQPRRGGGQRRDQRLALRRRGGLCPRRAGGAARRRAGAAVGGDVGPVPHAGRGRGGPRRPAGGRGEDVDGAQGWAALDRGEDPTR